MDYASLPILDLIPALSPELRSPHHLQDWCNIIEEAARRVPLTAEPLRAMCCVPIRHYKTETTLHGIVRLLLVDPTRRIIFLTHSLEAAQQRGKRLRQLATAAGVGPTRGWDTITLWQNDKGGGVVVMSAEQSKLGYDCHALVVDDPHDEHSAEDPAKREAVDHAIAHYTARCVRNGVPGPVLILMSPWHPDDAVGRRLHRTAVEWRYVHHAAIVNEGLPDERAFAPDVWPLAALRKARAELREQDPTERLWWAQFMCTPRPEGADLFGAATYYSKLPDIVYRRGFGVDLAFTSGAGSDWFARVVGRVYAKRLYLLDVVRHKIDAHLIESTCKADMTKHGRAPFYSYMSGPEVGMARVLRERGVPIKVMRARYNKLVRAQRTVKRWNDNVIVVPEDGLWVPGFLRRVGMFRGHEQASDDDEIDALVSIADAMMGGAVGGTVGRIGIVNAGRARTV